MRHGGAPAFQPPRLTPAVKILLVSLIAMFLGQLIFDRALGSMLFTHLLGFTPAEFASGKLWQLITYAFLHGSPSHLFFNGFMLFMLGIQLEAFWGTRAFVKFYFVTAVGAALLQTLIWLLSFVLFPNQSDVLGQIPIVGASGAIYGLFMAYALLFGDTYFLAFFVFPIKAKYLVAIMGGMALVSSIFYGHDGVAHLVHLGGLVAGYLYIKWKGPTLRGGGGWPFRKKKMTREEVRQRLSVITNEDFGDKGHPIRWN